jgi:NAD(P)-dependent dehydrogenase (short-subunit alcohol dehydrogenase family)
LAELDDRVVAITGAGGGLGPSVATALAGVGAKLALADLTEEALDGLGRDLGGIGEERLLADAVDLLEPAEVEGWRDRVLERWGRIDAVAHLVGGWRGGDPFPAAPLDDYEWLHDGLVRTLQHVSRTLHAPLLEAPAGRFVIVSSTQARSPEGASAAYAATKAAAEAWTLALADSFEGTDATANVVVVDAILTPAMRRQNPDGDHRGLTAAEDIAEAIRWLFSDATATMNGQRLDLHG